MSYLIDTNVLSELRRKAPEPSVVSWFEKRPPAALYLSVLTLGEIRKGVTRNVRDFMALPVTTINPWDPDA